MMLTALDDEKSEVTGLKHGADDYLAKPFRYAVFVARLTALLRRTNREASATQTVGKLTVEPEKRRVFAAGEEVFLHPAAEDPADEQQGQRTDAPGCKGQPAFQQQSGDGKAEIVDGEKHRNRYLPDEL